MDLALIVVVVVGNLRLGRKRSRERGEYWRRDSHKEKGNMANSVQGLN